MANVSKHFTNFKIHTQYSICEGAIKIEDLKNFCKENKILSAGLSDSYNLCGSLEFSENLSKSGTQPIIGTQILFTYGGEIGLIPLIAKTDIGYKSIVRLSSKSYLENDGLSDPICQFEDLTNNINDILVKFTILYGKLTEVITKAYSPEGDKGPEISPLEKKEINTAITLLENKILKLKKAVDIKKI